jgi:hypothetical protein
MAAAGTDAPLRFDNDDDEEGAWTYRCCCDPCRQNKFHQYPHLIIHIECLLSALKCDANSSGIAGADFKLPT